MRIILFLFFVCFIQSFALDLKSQNAKISISVTKMKLQDIFEKIEDQSKYRFAYNKNEIDVDRNCSVNVNNVEIKELLNQLFSNGDVNYTIVDRQIVLSSSKETPDIQQQKSISGKVTDSSSAPLPGVSVVVKGTTIGIITDGNGSYFLSTIPENAILQFSFVGMKTQEIAVSGKKTINVTLMEDAIGIEEVVAVGYGTQKKSDLTGAIGIISQENVLTMPITRFDQAIQGRVSGISITQSGQPGGDVNIRIRGIGTINNNSPLFVIDGVPVFGDVGLNDLNPNDILSMEVLKDGASSAIYGSRAANGVIIVTTKRGKEGQTTLSYNGNYSVQSIAKKLNVLDAEQYALLQNEARAAQGVDPLTADWWDPANIPDAANTNWQEQIFNIAPMQDHTITVSGGNKNANFLISGNYKDQQGVVKESGFKRYSFRINTDAKLLKMITVGTSILLSQTNENLMGNGGTVNNAIFYTPLIPAKFADGSWGAPQADVDLYSAGLNPLASLYLGKNQKDNYNVLANFFAEIELFKGLKYKFSYSGNLIDSRYDYFAPSFYHGPSTYRSQAYLSVINSRRTEYAAENIFSYNRIFCQKHDLSLTAVYSAQETNYNDESGTATGLISNSTPYLSDNTGVYSVGSNINSFSLLSYVGRANYSYDGKYLFSATIRRDGSSRFGANNPWGTFPAFSAGWRISQEPFMQNVDFINDLKLRLSWGKSGNQEIGNYAFSSSLGNSFNYVFGSSQSLASGVAPSSLANPDLKWEATTQSNIGIDLALWKNRFTLSANYYIKKTNDILLQVPIPKLTGISVFPTRNMGSMENKGFELELGYKQNFGKVTIDLAGNISTNKNTLLKLIYNNPIFDGTFVPSGEARGGENITITREGDPIGSYYGYVMDGIFQNQLEIDNAPVQGTNTRPGDIRFLDLNGDKVIDTKDRKIIGNPFPDFIYGLSVNLKYKNFDVNMFLQGVQGNEIYNGIRTRYADMYNLGNNLTEVLGRWRGEGTSNSEPRAIKFDPAENGRTSTRWIEDGSYLRLKNLSIGYTFPTDILNKINVQKTRVFASVTNVFTLTNYTGIDPEISEKSNNVKFAGVDYNTYPLARTIALGINFTF